MKIHNVSLEEMRSLYLPIIESPAPLLQQFRIHQWSPEEPLPSTGQKTIFSDNAPRLRHFSGVDFTVSPRASWLLGLTTFETLRSRSFTTDLREMLHVLSGMPRLRSLIIGQRIEEDVSILNSITDYPVVSLIFLKYMVVQCDIVGFFMLVDRIKRSPSGCLVNFKSSINDNLSAFDSVISSLFTRLLSDNLRFLYGSNRIEQMYLCIRDGVHFTVEEHWSITPIARGFGVEYLPQQISDKNIHMSLVLDTEGLYDTYSRAMGEIFGSETFKNLTTFQLALHLERPRYLLFLLFLESVTTIEAPYHTMRYLERSSSRGESAWPRDSSDQPIIPFPKLKRIRFYADTNPYYSPGMLRNLLINRSHLEQKVENLKIIRTPRLPELVETFEDIPGLKTLTIQYHDDMTIHHTYDCKEATEN